MIIFFCIHLYNGVVQVYIEYVIIDNLCVDFVLLYLVAKILNVKPKWYKYILSCFIGTLFAIVIPLFAMPIYISIPLKLLVGFVLSTLLLLGQPFFVKFIGFVFLMVFTFSLGGMTMALIYLFTKNVSSTFLISYGGGLPIGLLVLASFLIMQFVLYLSKYVKERRIIAPFLQDIKVKINGNIVKLSGFMDSGNRLEDDISGLPVIVVSKYSLQKKLPSEFKTYFNTGQMPKQLNAHYIDAETTSGKSKMLIFSPESVYIGNIKKKALIGLSSQNFSEVVKVEALFGPALL